MTLEQIFQSFNKLKVLIVGDLMGDAYVWGRADRISPEAPVPVVTVLRRELRLGGAGNVVMNLAALGAEPILCAVIGNDAPGKQIVALFKDKKLPTDGLLVSKSRPTTIKERIMAGSQQLARIDSESDELLNADDQRKITELISSQIDAGADVLIFQDYDKGVLSKELIETITEKALAKNIPVVVDPKKRNFKFYKKASLFKPNLKELREGLGISFRASVPEEIESAIDKLKSELELDGAFLTLSERGVFIDYRGQKAHVPAHLRSIADVSGAGDTVISIAACCVALGLEPRLIAELSNLGGGLVCEQVGVVPINKELLFKEAQAFL